MLPSGALLISKPDGMTSSQVVSKLKWVLTHFGYAERGFKIGHGGTLDPFATGVLVVLIGEATKLADTYLHSVKAYDGIIKLGVATETGDLTGQTSEQKSVPSLAIGEWQKLAARFCDGNYLQVPPMYSAKKKNGAALYELARAGIEVEREAIRKTIYSFEVQEGDSPDELRFTVACESGTYIRVLAEDLAKLAGTVAHLKTLRRTQSSDIDLEACIPLEAMVQTLESKSLPEKIQNFRGLEDISTHLMSFELSIDQCESIWKGLQRDIQMLCGAASKEYSDKKYVLGRCQGLPVALLENSKDSNAFRLQRVFNEAKRLATT